MKLIRQPFPAHVAVEKLPGVVITVKRSADHLVLPKLGRTEIDRVDAANSIERHAAFTHCMYCVQGKFGPGSVCAQSSVRLRAVVRSPWPQKPVNNPALIWAGVNFTIEIPYCFAFFAVSLADICSICCENGLFQSVVVYPACSKWSAWSFTE